VAEGQSLEEAGISGCLGGLWAHIDGSGTAGATQRQGIFFVELDGVDGRVALFSIPSDG
jgi:hypothetical protein